MSRALLRKNGYASSSGIPSIGSHRAQLRADHARKNASCASWKLLVPPNPRDGLRGEKNSTQLTARSDFASPLRTTLPGGPVALLLGGASSAGQLPALKLEVSTWRTQSYGDVAAGRMDTALSAEEAPSTLETEIIFSFDLVCLVGSGLRFRSLYRFTLKQYLDFPHALVESLDGVNKRWLTDLLAQVGKKRHVALSLPLLCRGDLCHRPDGSDFR